MDARRWQAVRETFAEGLRLDPALRLDELRRRYGDDPDLVAEVEDLLGQHEAAVVEGYYVPPDDVGDEPTEPIDDDPPGRTLQPGERIGPYAIQRLLGHGGMGTVYLAERVEDYDQQVALKLIRAEVTTGRLRRFHAKHQVLAKLDHPNIVRLLGGGNTTSGAAYLVMEYVDGKALDEDCDHRGLSVHDQAGASSRLSGRWPTPRPGRFASRPQALQRPGDRRGRAQDHRLWACPPDPEGDRHDPDRLDDDPRHAHLHGPGTDRRWPRAEPAGRGLLSLARSSTAFWPGGPPSGPARRSRPA